MLARIQRYGNLPDDGNSLYKPSVSQKVQGRLTIWPSNPTLKFKPKTNENPYFHGFVLVCTCSSRHYLYE